MTCNVFKTEAMTMGEAHRILGTTEEEMKRCAVREHDVMPGGETMFMCGQGLIVPVCRCGHASDFLCDYPIGDGKTCDLPLCSSCRHPVAEETDLCAIHAHEFGGKASSFQAWPSRESK